MRFGAIANSARGGPPRPPPPVRDRVNNNFWSKRGNSRYLLSFVIIGGLSERLAFLKLQVLWTLGGGGLSNLC